MTTKSRFMVMGLPLVGAALKKAAELILGGLFHVVC